MKNMLYTTFFLGIASFVTLSNTSVEKEIKPVATAKEITNRKVISPEQVLYKQINLKGILDYKVFETALNGYKNLKHTLKNKDVITVIDFSLPSSAKRMYVIDLLNKKLLFHSIVSHGKNSGDLYATDFSNRNGSHQSSLGFYVTENTYQGGNGYSLVINGLEKDINDLAKPRAVVIHGADYCSEDVIRNTGRLGRSYGCPALPRELNKPIINTIKNGSMLFIYADNKEYLASSKFVRSKDQTILAMHDAVESEKQL